MVLQTGQAFDRLNEARRLVTVVYVNTVTGNDSNNGTSPGSAKLTLAAAQALLPASGGIIRIKAPSTNPVVGFVNFTAGNIILESSDDDYWYVERTTTLSTWTSQGGGVYSRSDGGATSTVLFVPTLSDSNGFELMLTKNVSTPTTPAAGEFGQSGGNYYIRLPGDENPSAHTIKRANTSYLFQSSGTCILTVKKCIGRYTGSGGIFANVSTTSGMVLERCVAQYSEATGITNAGAFLIATDCLAYRHVNDGFSNNAGVFYAIDCEALYNDDEGFGMHSGSQSFVIRGRYHHNQSAGLSSVNTNTKAQIIDSLVDFNGAKNQAGVERHGIVFDTGTSGSVINTISRNNTGSGFYCNGGTVTLTNLTSGTGQGNTEADDAC